MVWNMNGRVPDEGAVSEAAMAWTLGKPLIAYRDDARSLIAGRTNPLLAGLVDFTVVHEIGDIPAALVLETQRTRIQPVDFDRMSAKLKAACDRGAELWKVLQLENAFGENHLIADCVTKLFSPSSVHKLHLATR